MTVVSPNDPFSSKPKWKCPDCGLINSCSLDTPCAACFWTISAKQKLLLDLVNSKDRNSKVFCVLWKHLNQRDIVKLILEFDPTNSLLDCSVELGEETQEEYIEKYVFDNGDPGRVLIRTALSAESSKAFCEMVTWFNYTSTMAPDYLRWNNTKVFSLIRSSGVPSAIQARSESWRP